MKLQLLPLLLISFLFSCQTKEQADLIVHNALVYTVNAEFGKAEAFAVKGGKFLAVGNSADILAKYQAKNVINAQGKPVYPGFYDAHCHFYGYGNFLQDVDLIGTKSFQEILDKLVIYRKQNPNKRWIIGRGWDQNDWESKEFPSKSALDSLFPDTPVFLSRVDGHAALVNQKAFDLAKITPTSKIALGGLIEIKQGKLTGILVDNAMDLVSKFIPPPTQSEIEKALLDAQAKCFAVGLTSVGDAGLEREIVETIDQLNKNNKLKMRMYVMLSSTEKNFKHYLNRKPYKTDFLNVRSFKIYADGALGSRGACLLKPYSDKSDQIGFLLSSPAELERQISQISAKGYQVNTHCIGDSSNRAVLDIYAKYLKSKNDLRWRIEHAQVVSVSDVAKFGKYSVIPSVQPTHCTSDMYWAGDRLGKERVKTAYAFKDLLAQNKMIAFGSDFPVEHINPLYGFHAAVARQDAKNYPKGGFQPENAVSREDALRAMTIWAAFAGFEDKEKGSIEAGKFADFVLLENDLMSIAPEKMRQIKVLQTYVNGEQVFK